MTIYSVKFNIFWANSGLCHFHSRPVNSLKLDGCSAFNLINILCAHPVEWLRHFARPMQNDCVWVKRELWDAGRQKPVTCLEPVLSVSQPSLSLWPRPVFPRSEQVASSGIIPACASLCCCKKISWLWPGTFLSTATGVGSPAARPVCSPVYACLGMKIAC